MKKFFLRRLLPVAMCLLVVCYNFAFSCFASSLQFLDGFLSVTVSSSNGGDVSSPSITVPLNTSFTPSSYKTFNLFTYGTFGASYPEYISDYLDYFVPRSFVYYPSDFTFPAGSYVWDISFRWVIDVECDFTPVSSGFYFYDWGSAVSNFNYLLEDGIQLPYMLFFDGVGGVIVPDKFAGYPNAITGWDVEYSFSSGGGAYYVTSDGYTISSFNEGDSGFFVTFSDLLSNRTAVTLYSSIINMQIKFTVPEYASGVFGSPCLLSSANWAEFCSICDFSVGLWSLRADFEMTQSYIYAGLDNVSVDLSGIQFGVDKIVNDLAYYFPLVFTKLTSLSGQISSVDSDIGALSNQLDLIYSYLSVLSNYDLQILDQLELSIEGGSGSVDTSAIEHYLDQILGSLTVNEQDGLQQIYNQLDVLLQALPEDDYEEFREQVLQMMFDTNVSLGNIEAYFEYWFPDLLEQVRELGVGQEYILQTLVDLYLLQRNMYNYLSNPSSGLPGVISAIRDVGASVGDILNVLSSGSSFDVVSDNEDFFDSGLSDFGLVLPLVDISIWKIIKYSYDALMSTLSMFWVIGLGDALSLLPGSVDAVIALTDPDPSVLPPLGPGEVIVPYSLEPDEEEGGLVDIWGY